MLSPDDDCPHFNWPVELQAMPIAPFGSKCKRPILTVMMRLRVAARRGRRYFARSWLLLVLRRRAWTTCFIIFKAWPRTFVSTTIYYWHFSQGGWIIFFYLNVMYYFPLSVSCAIGEQFVFFARRDSHGSGECFFGWWWTRLESSYFRRGLV